jgi:hypothetical protein
LHKNPPPFISFGAGAQFAVTREEILKHSLGFYKTAFIMCNEPSAPWVFERMWGFIFDPRRGLTCPLHL